LDVTEQYLLAMATQDRGLWIPALKWAKPASFQILSDFSLTDHNIIALFMHTKN
jgi:hypothetical protein